MWKRTHTKFYPNVSPQAIWNLWVDINNWPRWHGDLDSCTLVGGFKVGSHFMLKPKGMRAFKIDLVDIKEGKSFTDCTKFFGAKMFDTHSMKVRDGGIELSNELIVTGPLRWFWIALVARKVAATIPAEVDALVELARKQG